MKLTVFILAAGLGERLRPVTNDIPKPLIPILGKPVLQSIIERAFKLPAYKIGINLHHKKEAIENWITRSPYCKGIHLFPEDHILGTGGALKNASSFLKGGTFLVHNSDVLSDIDLWKLADYHLSSGNLVTLAVHDYPEFNNLEVDEKGFLKGIINHPHPNPPPSRGRDLSDGERDTKAVPRSPDSRNPKTNTLSPDRRETKNSPSPGGRGLGEGGNEPSKFLAFTGIAVYQPEFLQFLPRGASSIVDAWLKAIIAGHKIGTFDVSGCHWRDIGTPASYAKAVADELRNNGEMVYIDQSVKGCSDIEIDGFVVIEKGSKLAKGTALRNCIILPETETEASDQENCIIGPGFKIDLKESDFFNADESADGILIGTGGSDRKYFRVKRNRNSVVLMQCNENDPDYGRHIEYTRFFQKYSIPVPELLNADSSKMRAYFEDLGDLTLYNWLKCPRDLKQIERIYKKIIDNLILIHTRATEHLSECPLLQQRVFDYDYLRWETGYFLERFVMGVKNIKVRNPSALEDEFHRLGAKTDSFPKTIVHRDFQSQNIMITKGGIPRFLDFQGARIGPTAYDVASLLWDPYYCLDDKVRKRLLKYYLNKVPSQNPPFASTILPCRLQRHMQALGAYGFLSVVKGKTYFRKYILEGLRLLKEDVTLAKNEYPELYKLVMEL